MVAVAMNSRARSRCRLSAELSLFLLSSPPLFDLPLLFLEPFLLAASLPPPTQLLRDTVLFPLSFRLRLNLDARSRGDSSRLKDYKNQMPIDFFDFVLSVPSSIPRASLYVVRIQGQRDGVRPHC